MYGKVGCCVHSPSWRTNSSRVHIAVAETVLNEKFMFDNDVYRISDSVIISAGMVPEFPPSTLVKWRLCDVKVKKNKKEKKPEGRREI